MDVGPTARSAQNISGGSRKYRKGVDHRKGVVPLERGDVKCCRAMITGILKSMMMSNMQNNLAERFYVGFVATHSPEEV